MIRRRSLSNKKSQILEKEIYAYNFEGSYIAKNNDYTDDSNALIFKYLLSSDQLSWIASDDNFKNYLIHISVYPKNMGKDFIDNTGHGFGSSILSEQLPGSALLIIIFNLEGLFLINHNFMISADNGGTISDINTVNSLRNGYIYRFKLSSNNDGTSSADVQAKLYSIGYGEVVSDVHIPRLSFGGGNFAFLTPISNGVFFSNNDNVVECNIKMYVVVNTDESVDL